MTATIHASMGNKPLKVATNISDDNGNFKLWYKAKLAAVKISNQIQMILL